MEISLANERAFQITPQVPLETARVRVDDKRTAAGGRHGGRAALAAQGRRRSSCWRPRTAWSHSGW